MNFHVILVMDVAFCITKIVVIKVHILKIYRVKVCFLYMISKIKCTTNYANSFISQLHIRLIIFVYPNIIHKNATNVTGEVHLNHHLQDATEIQKMEQIVKCFCFYKLQTYHYT